MKVAAIDIGTNTVLLLVATRDDASGGLRAELDLATITRLGEGVDRTQALASNACQRTLDCLARYRQALDEHGVDALDIVGTSALRDALGAADFIARAGAILGVPPRVISGEEEAALTFEGSLSGLDLSGNVCVFDIGGGSTELIVGRASPARSSAHVSLDVGSVRLYERHVRSDPATVAERDSISVDIRRALGRAPKPPADAVLVGVAGTVTQLAALELELERYDSARVHGHRMRSKSLCELADQLDGLPLSARKSLRGMEPGRADVIGVGARIVVEVLNFTGAETLIVSDRGVRWGLAQRLTAQADADVHGQKQG